MRVKKLRKLLKEAPQEALVEGHFHEEDGTYRTLPLGIVGGRWEITSQEGGGYPVVVLSFRKKPNA